MKIRKLTALSLAWLYAAAAFSGAASPAGAAALTGNTAPGGFESAGASSGLAIWLRADAGVSVDGSSGVMAWTDQSANAYTASALQSSERPLATTANFGGATRDVLRFTGDDVLTFGLPSALANVPRQSHTVFFVAARTGGSSDEGNVFGFDKTGGRAQDGWYYKFRQAGVAMESGDGSNHGYQLNSSQPAGPFLIAGGRYSASETSARLFINGTLADSDEAAAGAINEPANTRLNIGAFDTPSGSGAPTGFTNFFRGDIAEIVLFDRALGAAEQVLVENHLSAKFRIAMTANDFYSGDTISGGSGHDYGVFGVGRTTGSDQVLSAGMDGMGIEAASLGENHWVLAGHNNPGVNELAAFGDFAGLRWLREWFVDVTGSVAAELSFNFDDAGLPGLNPSGTPSLLYREELSDNWQVIAGLSHLDGDTLVFSLGNLQTGFFTLGIVPIIPEPGTCMLVVLGMVAAGASRRTAAGRKRR